jgi:hypothetical protein
VSCDTRTFPRFRAPSAPPLRRDPPIPGLPAWVTLRPRPSVGASTPFSLSGLPGILSTRRAHGVRCLQSLTSQRSPHLSVRLPLLRLAEPSRHSSATTHAESLDYDGPRFRGLFPLTGWAHPLRISPRCGELGSLGIHPSWGFPLPEPRASSAARRPRQATAQPCCRYRTHLAARTRACSIGSPLGTSGKIPKDPAPYAPEFQRAGKLACLFRDCRPLQGFGPRSLTRT